MRYEVCAELRSLPGMFLDAFPGDHMPSLRAESLHWHTVEMFQRKFRMLLKMPDIPEFHRLPEIQLVAATVRKHVLWSI